jgi:hypothetical protein
MNEKERQVKGSELKAGDVLKTWSGLKTITHFTDHPGLRGEAARIAWSGDWGMTVFDNETKTIIRVQQ